MELTCPSKARSLDWRVVSLATNIRILFDQTSLSRWLLRIPQWQFRTTLESFSLINHPATLQPDWCIVSYRSYCNNDGGTANLVMNIAVTSSCRIASIAQLITPTSSADSPTATATATFVHVRVGVVFVHCVFIEVIWGILNWYSYNHDLELRYFY